MKPWTHDFLTAWRLFRELRHLPNGGHVTIHPWRFRLITHLCKKCETPVQVDRIDVSTPMSGRLFAWGIWQACTACGSTAEPLAVIDANDKRLNIHGKG
jgi:hypothetical protein